MGRSQTELAAFLRALTLEAHQDVLRLAKEERDKDAHFAFIYGLLEHHHNGNKGQIVGALVRLIGNIVGGDKVLSHRHVREAIIHSLTRELS